MGKWGKQFLLAGSAVVSAVAMANVGVAKYIGKLVEAEDELEAFAKQHGMTRDEAYKTKSALDAMGKSLEEIQANPRLLHQYRELRENAENLKPPDMSEGLNQVRSIIGEYTKFKQIGSAALQWIGHYTLKYVARPLEQVNRKMGGINKTLTKNLPAWSEKIGMALSWIVRLGMTLIRGAGAVFNAIKKIFDMIPGGVKIAMGALAGLALFIRAGPIGKLITILSIALLLLEDFFTYLDGGQSLLGPFWEKVVGAFQGVRETFQSAKEYLSGLYEKFKEGGSIEAFGGLLESVRDLIATIIKVLKDLGGGLLDTFSGPGKAAVEWFVSDGLPGFIRLVSDVINFVSNLLNKLNDMGAVKPIVLGVVGAFAGFKTVKGIGKTIGGIADAIKKASDKFDTMAKSVDTAKNSINKLGKIGQIKSNLAELGSSFSGLAKSIGSFTIAKVKDIGMTVQLLALYAKDAIVKGASTVATWAQTAATTAWNAAAGIGAVVTKAFGAAMAFLTSPIGLVILAIVALIAIVVLLIKNWETVKEFFINLWDKIKETFAGIGEWFSDKFGEAVEKIKKVFAPIVDWFKEKIDKIKGFFTGIGDKVKGIFSGGGSDPDTPGHEDGGIFTKEHTARFVEDDKPEAVVPLTKPNRAREVLGQIGQYLGGSAPGMESIEKMASSMLTFMNKATNMLTKFDATLNAGALAAATAGSGGNITYNNQKYDMSRSTKVYTNSDKPQEVAEAVDRTQQMTIRNLKDVIE